MRIKGGNKNTESFYDCHENHDIEDQTEYNNDCA